jgi:hypothetical protein
MKTKILVLIYLTIFLTALYFIYPVVKNRYFKSENKNKQTDQLLDKKNNRPSNNNQTTSDINNDTGEVADTSMENDESFIDITTEDCDNNCQQFEDVDDREYCLEYCGTNSDHTIEDCEKLVELEKDYCLKNKAIAEKRFDLCEKIIDKKIMESCKNRLTEDIVNGSKLID